MSAESSKTKKNSSNPTNAGAMTTQPVSLDRQQIALINKICDTFYGFYDRWKASHQERQALTAKCTGRGQVLGLSLLGSYSKTTGILAARVQQNVSVLKVAVRRGRVHKTQCTIETLQNDVDEMERAVMSMEREMTRIRTTVNAAKEGASKKNKKTTKRIIRV